MQLNLNNYQEYLHGITVVEISGEGCANCISLMPVLAALMKNRNDAVLHHVELEESNMEFVDIFGIQSIPSIVILYNDIVCAKCKGYQPEEILELWLDAKIAEIKKQYNIN